MAPHTQTKTPYIHLRGPSKEALLQDFDGRRLEELRTPAFIIDRRLFARNCAAMHNKATSWGAAFRAHVKTHKTLEGTKLQLVSEGGRSHSVVVSTVLEAWEVVRAGLVIDGTVKDILYGLPVAANKIADLSELWDAIGDHGAVVRVMIDHPAQVKFLEEFEKTRKNPKRWSAFIKINGGQHRAGVQPASPDLKDLVSALLQSPAVSIYGFYGHAGNAYASTSVEEATSFLSSEVDSVNVAAGIALQMLPGSAFPNAHTQPFVLSVGSTPTAHAAGAEARAILAKVLNGSLELHAGNYPLLDLQQQHTNLIDQENISQRVRATIVSYYPGRAPGGEDEALVDAGAIAFSKDTGPAGGFGHVIGKAWQLGRISQEHGILTQLPGHPHGASDSLEVGEQVEIVGQHACLIAAAYPWYYVVDKDINGGQTVVDIWVPWKGW